MKPPTPDETSKRAATEWLVKLQSPQLTPSQEAAFFVWLDQKPEHQQAYIEAEQHWSSLAVVEKIPRAAAGPAASTTAVKWYSHPRAIAATFAGLAMILLLQLWPAPKGTQYQTRTGERQQVKLTDGSDIHLNTNSRLQVELNSQHRLVRLETGEAFFNISRDTRRPFVVATPGGSVRVLGTRFNVRSSKLGTIITVVEGRVGVARDISLDTLAAADFKPKTQLIENQQITLAADQSDNPLRQVDAAAVTTWRNGKQVYNGERFVEVVADLSRYFAGDIKLGDPALENIEIVAVIDLQNKASAIAALESAFNVVAVEKSAGLVVLYPAKQN